MKKKTRSWLLIFVFTAVFFFIVNRVFVFSPTTVERVSSMILYPFLHLQRTVVNSMNTWVYNRKTAAQLRKELVQVMLERDELYAENVALKTTGVYAEQIKELLEFKERYEQDQIIAHILLRHIGKDAHYILVDAGEKKGIAVDMPVIYKNNLLGRVVEVWPWYSKVILTTDATCKVSAECTDTKIRGIHQGDNKTQQTLLTHVSHLLQLKKNDLIISSGEGLIFPRGFALGNIEDFEVQGLQYKITIRPPLSIHCLDCCAILPNRS